MIHLENEYYLTTSSDDFQLDAIHAYLCRSYWAEGITKEVVQRAIANSIGVGVFYKDAQIAFARVTTDKATFAYLADVYVLEDHRGNGLAVAMVLALHNHPELQGLRRWMLATKDAHNVYAKLGWQPLADASIFMQRHFPDVYK
jgi:GNAT superfamily N-acetyltransferase